MKLNHRDRVLITIVFVAAVWIIGVWFFVVPAFQELGEKRDELNDKQVTLSDKKDQIERDKDLPQLIEKAYARSEELAKNFYTKQTSQTASDTVDKLLDEQKIVNSTLQISEYTVKVIKPFYYVNKLKTTDFDNQVLEYDKIGASSSKADTSSKIDTSAKQRTTNSGNVIAIDPNAGIQIGSYDIELSIKGKYGDIQKFCEQLTKNVPSSMVVSGLQILDVNGIKEEKKDGEDSSSSQAEEKKEDGKEKTIDDNEVEGTLNINIMIVEKLKKPEF
jgi:hypothetical protein